MARLASTASASAIRLYGKPGQRKRVDRDCLRCVLAVNVHEAGTSKPCHGRDGSESFLRGGAQGLAALTARHSGIAPIRRTARVKAAACEAETARVQGVLRVYR